MSEILGKNDVFDPAFPRVALHGDYYCDDRCRQSLQSRGLRLPPSVLNDTGVALCGYPGEIGK